MTAIVAQSVDAQNANFSPFAYFNRLGIHCTRIVNRFIRTMTTLAKNPELPVAAVSENLAETKAIYRLMKSEKVSDDAILQAQRIETVRRIVAHAEPVILLVQDTSELNYAGLKATSGLGDGTAKNRALHLHTGIAMTTSGQTLGLIHQDCWARDPELRGQRKVNRPLEEKESHKWVKCALASVAGLPADVRAVHVGDREADFFEFFHTLEQHGQTYLVRAVQDRITDPQDADQQDDDQQNKWLFDRVRKQKVAGTFRVNIPRDSRRGLLARETTLEIRYVPSQIQVPYHLKQKLGDSNTLTCTIIQARETTPPEGEEPIEWLLVTNLAITTAEEAMAKVGWYVQRWKIERFHYVLKSGCEIEKIQAEQASRIKRQILMYSIVALRVLSITYAARLTPDAPCTEVFDDEEWRVLYRVAQKTSVLPATPPTVKEAVGYLAKLGGFLGRKSDGDPGVKVIWRGFRALHVLLDNYRYLL